MATKSISELTTAPDVELTDLIEVAQADKSSASGYKSYKQNLGNISDAFAREFVHNVLNTVAKNIVGAINEVEGRQRVMTATLTAGNTSLTFTSQDITSTSILILSAQDKDIEYLSCDTSTANQVTYTFEEQDSDVLFKLLITEV